VQTHQNYTSFHTDTPTIVTMGMFDGVHVWHRELIGQLVSEAKTRGCESVVMTFWPYPAVALGKTSDIKLLTTLDEKLSILSELWVDHVIVQEFTPDFAAMSGLEYVQRVLVEQLHVQMVMIWHDHRFGRDRGAGYDDLVGRGHDYGFTVARTDAHQHSDQVISSTAVRQSIIIGDMTRAHELLGYAYRMRGVLSLERKFRESMTASFVLCDDIKLIPWDGVYRVQIGDVVREFTVVWWVMSIWLQHRDSVVFDEKLEIVFA